VTCMIAAKSRAVGRHCPARSGQPLDTVSADSQRASGHGRRGSTLGACQSDDVDHAAIQALRRSPLAINPDMFSRTPFTFLAAKLTE
jgi:hypothetical protein